ncbi:hypothetical protein H2201_009278, partial [Coniosporium apollinis]
CQKHQFAAFIADRGILIVWDDEPKKLIGRVERLEQALVTMIWGNGDAYPEEKEEKQEKPAQFFFQALAGNIPQCIGPVGQIAENTKSYSGFKPRRPNRERGPLPHVTIQCPVYKEGLHSVIEPTIRSIKAAISTYEMQGGTANIFVNDDGMQLLPGNEARQRQDFYDEHNIGWVARPKHNSKPIEGSDEIFLRLGKFKKASNMNYALGVEDKLAKGFRPETWSREDEAAHTPKH